MKSEEDIQGSINLMSAYAEQDKKRALECNNAEDAARYLRDYYTWRLRVEMLEWVLRPGG